MSNRRGRSTNIRNNSEHESSTGSATRKNLRPRYAVGYTASFLFLLAVVAVGYQPPERVGGQVNNQQSSNVSSLITTVDNSVTPSIDDIVATDIAANISERANLPVAASIANMSVSLNVKNQLAQTSDSSITKPQIVKPEATSRAVTYYTAKKGDTVQSVARAHGRDADTVRWANNLERDSIEKGRKVKILPVDGLQYRVKSGDTVAKIASRFGTSADRVISYNDLELSKPKRGQLLLIPSGSRPEPSGTSSTPSAQTFTRGSSSGAVVADPGIARASAGNRYAPGNCTWYAYERSKQLGRTIGSFWGNANTWASSARAAGFSVNGTPTAGSILVDTAGYYGHVAIVESVKPNGDIVISEMNNYAYGGFNIVNNRTISAGQARAYQYIH